MFAINRRFLQVMSLIMILLMLLCCCWQPYTKAAFVIDDLLIGACIAILILIGISFLPDAGWTDVSTGVGGFLEQFPAVAEGIQSNIHDGILSLSAATVALVKTAADEYFTAVQGSAGSLPVPGSGSITVTDWMQLEGADASGCVYLFGTGPSNAGQTLTLQSGAQGVITITVHDLYYQIGAVEHNPASHIQQIVVAFTSYNPNVSITTTTFDGTTSTRTVFNKPAPLSEGRIYIYQYAGSYNIHTSFVGSIFSFLVSQYAGFDGYLVGGECRLASGYPISFTVSISGFDGIGDDVLPYNHNEVYTVGQISDVIGLVGAEDAAGTKSIPVSIPAVGSIPQTVGDVLTGDVVTELDKIKEGTGTGTEEGTQTETKEEDLEKGKLTPLIFTKFPFCLPWDLYAAFAVLRSDPVAPKFEIPFKLGTQINETIDLDLSWLEPVVVILRWFLLLAFVYSLILVTQKVIRW